MRDPKLIKKVFELSLTLGHRAIGKELGIGERMARRILDKKYPNNVVPLDLQEKSKEARKKRRFANYERLEGIIKALRKHLIRKIMEVRELKKENQRLRDILELVKAQQEEKSYQECFMPYEEQVEIWR